MFNKKKRRHSIYNIINPGIRVGVWKKKKTRYSMLFGYENDRKQQYMSFGIIVSQYTLQKRIGETLDNRYIIIMGIPFR